MSISTRYQANALFHAQVPALNRGLRQNSHDNRFLLDIYELTRNNTRSTITKRFQMSKMKVLLTRQWPQSVQDALQRSYDFTFNNTDTPMTAADFRAALQHFDVILPTVTDVLGADVFDGITPRTRFIGNFGVGYTHIDTMAAKSAGIIVSNTPDVLSDCTADLTLTLMLMAARRAGEGERELRAGNWTGWRPTHMMGQKLTGKTLGIIGYGRIGQQVAKRAHFGFGMNIVVQNRSVVNDDILAVTEATQLSSIDMLCTQSDFISLHCPGGDANRNMIGAEQLDQMKETAILINTARGEVVDETALIHALKTRKIAAAGLDVFDGEPHVNPDFLTCENAVLLPHLGSATLETRTAMGFRVMDNLADFCAGRDPRDRVA
jgi:glyoxylate reductase